MTYIICLKGKLNVYVQIKIPQHIGNLDYKICQSSKEMRLTYNVLSRVFLSFYAEYFMNFCSFTMTQLTNVWNAEDCFVTVIVLF